ncbi:hypothetical protein KI387_008304, partial [Taxus chinensis]
ISPASAYPADVDDLAFTFRFSNLLALSPIDRSTFSRCRSSSVDADHISRRRFFIINADHISRRRLYIIDADHPAD